ncbi:UDP-glucose 4-epimerase [Leucobacter komagatae]|uniref:UDP-glucose 4-epimerase n=1 Tax=Leucobacter komagatae TaxID=55969 RepID=A0A0D0IQN6_9MICO|nr:UDP-glucose 4-epimerase [Leucobacter komagatae]
MPGAIQARPELAGESDSRLAFTPDAIALIDQLWTMHGPLMFHQSGGCCDGSAPMCYQEGEFKTGGQDLLLGTLELPPLAAEGDPREIGFWMSREQFGVWSHTHLTIDAVPGRGSGFSLEAPEGKRFLIRSRLL